MEGESDIEREKKKKEKSWGEIICYCLDLRWLQLLWTRVVLRKWLNLSAIDATSDYSADSDHGSDLDSLDHLREWDRESRFQRGNKADEADNDATGVLPRLKRRKSAIFRTQYINTKEIRVCVGTWNVGAQLPPDDLNIDGWLDITEPADIYVIGLQEIVPLDAVNIFGAEDSRPVQIWENIIRESLERVKPGKPKFASYSDPASPTKFKSFDKSLDLEDEIALQSDTEDIFKGVHEPKDGSAVGKSSLTNPNTQNSYDYSPSGMPSYQDLVSKFSSIKGRARLNCPRREDCEETAFSRYENEFQETFSGIERIGLSWPEPSLDVVEKHTLDIQDPLKPLNSFKASKSLISCNSLEIITSHDNRARPGAALFEDIDLKSLVYKENRRPYVRIASKQMIGTFLTIWVRRSLRKHIQNLEVSTVGVGLIGYMGNKGSISVSMSIYQTLCCFICAHLTSGERDMDAVKRIADVNEILRRTQFHSLSNIGLTRTILDHERIIWLGDLNYRINLPYEETIELILKEDWSKLAENDQLKQELREGHVFDGWHEGSLNFPPTYKYDFNSDKYCGADPNVGRRNPAWCDRILSFGNGLRQLSYRRTELEFSDHRPVTAAFSMEVEVFCPRKLQKALSYTNAEVENHVNCT